MNVAMRHIWSVPVTVCLVTSVAQAQTAVTIDDLTAPTPPAFVLLDVSPASVERPETPKAFTLGILNKLASSGGLPQNYAVEIAPYWMASHPTLTFHQYQHPNVWRSVVQTFSLSVGTAPLPGSTAGADPTGTRLAAGARTNIFNGRPNPTLQDLVAMLHDVDDEILNALNANQPISPELRAKARDRAAAVQAADAERIGFFLTFAAGQAWAFPNDDLGRSVQERGALWLTPSYRFRACLTAEPCASMFDVIGVVRAMKEKNEDWAWDFGGRFLWRPTRAFDLSLESVGRKKPREAETGANASASGTSSRIAGILEYRIRQDVVLYASFGRDFKKATGVRPLVSFLGLNIGLGTKAVVKADRSESPGR